jgi:hypothetical protein
MRGKLRIVRDGVPHYVAPWFNTLSPETRKILGRQGPMACDPQGQLGLPVPDPDAMGQAVLDFGPMPCRTKPLPERSKAIPSDMQNEMLCALIALTDWLRDNTGPADSSHDLLVAAMATIKKAQA